MLPSHPPSLAMLRCNEEEVQKDAERRAAILANLERQYIVDELSEVEVAQDGRRRADLRAQPIETSRETSPTLCDSVLQANRHSTGTNTTRGCKSGKSQDV